MIGDSAKQLQFEHNSSPASFKRPYKYNARFLENSESSRKDISRSFQLL